MGRHSTLGRNRRKPLWRVVTSLLGIVSMVGAAAVAGTVISAQADTTGGLSVTAVVMPTPESGAPADAAALGSLAALSAGSTVQPGDELTYVLTVTNSSATGDAVPVTVVDDLSGLQASAQVTVSTDGAVLTGDQLTWTTPPVGPNQHVTMSFQATVSDGVESGATLETSATLPDVDGAAASTTSLTVQAADADAAETTDSPDTTTESDAAPTTDTDATTQTTDSAAPAAPETAPVSFRAENEDGDLLAGAAFTITGSSGAVFCVSDNSATGADAGCDDATAVADDDPADGAFLVSDLPADTYTIAAVTPPPNYEIPDETKTFTLEEEAAEAPATSDPDAGETDGVETDGVETSGTDAPETSGTDAPEMDGTDAPTTNDADIPATADAGQPLRGTLSAAFVSDQDNEISVLDAGVIVFLTTNTSIVVHLGGFRTGTSTVGPLPRGAALQAVPVGGGDTLTCSSNDDGDCTFADAVPGKQYDISQTGAPAGWYTNPQLDYGNSTSGTAADFVFRTKALVAGVNDVPGDVADNSFCDAKSTSCPRSTGSSSNGNPFLGLWQTSVQNNPMPAICGLNIALVMDVSGSMGLGADGRTSSSSNPSKLSLLKDAANGVVDALIPATSTKIALYSFAQGASKLTSLTATKTGSGGLRALINNLSASGGTNWDQGLYQVVSDRGSDQYDLVVVLTDGNPTYDHKGTGGSSNTRFDNVSQGIFSANAIKNLANTQGGKTRITTIGIGVLGGDENIRAISGTNQGSDYFLSSGSNFGDALRSTLLANCSLTVTKQVQSASGTAPASGWTMNATVSGQNWSATTTDSNGNAVFQFNPLPSGNVNFTVTENSKTGYHIVPVNGKNMQCVQGGTPLSVTDTQNGVTFTANPSNGGIHCTITNSDLVPPKLTLVKNVVGGSDAPSSWTLSATGSSGSFSGQGNTAAVTDQTVADGVTYKLDESGGPSGYDASQWACTGAATWDASAGTVTPGNAEDITCTITNTRQTANVVVKKVLSPAADTGRFDLSINGTLAKADAGNGDASAPVVVSVNDAVTVAEAAVSPAALANYGSTLQCKVDGSDITLSTNSGTVGTFTVPASAAGKTITCTFTNTRGSVQVNLQKMWVDGAAGDTAALSINGGASVDATVPDSGSGLSTDTATATVSSGSTVNLSEMLSGTGSYTVSDFTCTGATISWNDGASTASFTAPGSGTVTCKVTNKRTSTTLLLQKTWVGGMAANDAALSVSGSGHTGTATATVPSDNFNGTSTDTASISVFSGDTASLSETVNGPHSDAYSATLVCDAGDLTPAADGKSGSLQVPKNLNGNITCTFTNTAQPGKWQVEKTSNPVTGSVVEPDQTITYTLTATHLSGVSLTDLTVTDDLSDVVNHATFGTITPAGAATYDPATEKLTWNIAALNTTAAVSYTVTVNSDATNVVLKNHATGGTDGPCVTGCTTEHIVPAFNKMRMNTQQHLAADGSWDGTWDITYLLSVQNPSVASAVTYDLTDTPAFPADVTVNGAEVTGAVNSTTAADTPIADSLGTWSDPTLPIVSGRSLPALSTDKYTVVVNASVPPVPAAPTCNGTPGNGFYNAATATFGTYTITDNACDNIPRIGAPTITKTVAAGSPTQNADGTWTISYTVVVDNSANGYAARYSLTDTPDFGGDIAISGQQATGPDGVIPGWDGTAGNNVLATNATVAKNATATYTVTVTASVSAKAYEDSTATCAADKTQSAGHGFFNSATLTVPGHDAQHAADCASPVTPTLDKSGGTAVQHTDGSGAWDGTWDVTYTVTVDNSNDTAVYYTLSDTPQYPNKAAITDVTSTLGGTSYGTWNGTEIVNLQQPKDATPAAAKKLDAHSSDAYTIVVNVTVAPDIDPVVLQCATAAPKAGHGYYNDATVTSGSFTATDDDCGPIQLNPKPTVVKSVDGVPQQQADGSWNIDYTLTVTNPSATQKGRFSLSDAFHFGGGLTITPGSAQVTGPDASTGWNGVGNTAIVTDHTIEPHSTANPSLDYHVTVNATIATTWTSAQLDCTLDAGESGTGFLNTATITVGGQSQDSSDCASPATPVIEKTIGSVEQHATSPWDGTWDVTYTVTVTNPSSDTDLVYSLSDSPDFPAGVTINSASATLASAGSVGSWTSAPFGLASDKALAAKGADVYTVTVNVTVDISTVPAGAMDCTATPFTPKNGLYNAATVTSGGYSAEAIDCGDIPQAATPTLTKSVVGTPVQNPATGYWTITYDLVVDNSANDIAAKYSLTDSLAGYASGIDVKSASVSPDPTLGGWDGVANATITTDASIGANDTITYTVTVTADVTAQTAPDDWACTTPPSSGHGFFNTATITANGQDVTKDACAEPVKPVIEKTIGSVDQSVTSPWDGTWDVTYTVTVTNPSSDTDLVYSLSDSPDFPAGVTINSASATLATVGSVGNWTSAPFGLATARALAAKGADVYTVTVNVTVDSSTVPADAVDCTTTPHQPKHGLFNAATVTSGGYSATAIDCGSIPQPPRPDIVKTVTSVTQGTNGDWTVVYDLAVSNTSKTWSAPYDLSDTVTYGGHITVTSQSVTGPVGLTINPAWNGGVGTPADSDIVTGGVITRESVLHFTVTVTATVETAATATDLDCKVEGTETGSGFLNTATLVSGSNTVGPVTACATPVQPQITKTAGTPLQHLDATGNWDGSWDVPYIITVHNPSAATPTAPASNLTYTLSDTPAYPAGVTATDGTVTASNDGSGATVPGIAGTTAAGIFSGGTLSIITVTSGPRDLAAGATDTFDILINATVPLDQDASTLNCVGTTPGHGFDNDGTVTSGGSSYIASACADIPLVESPDITKTVTSTTQGADGTWTIEYHLLVDNSQNDLASMYTLDDALDYGTGIDVKTASVSPDPSGNWDGDSHQRIATDQPIAAKGTATYTVTVTADVTDQGTTISLNCVDQTTPGFGFFNGATLTVGSTPTKDSACSSPALPEIDKAFVSAVDNATGGWDVTYTLTVSNPSPDTALYFSLSDTPEFAPGVTVHGAEVTASDVIGVMPGSFDATTGVLTIIPDASPVSLGHGDSDSFTIVVSTEKPIAPLDPADLVCNPANPTPNQGFYNRADAHSGGVTYSDEACGAIPAWTVQKVVDKAVAHPGDTLTYTLTATNIGSVEVTGALATDTLPTNVTVTSLDSGLTDNGDGTLTWTLPTLTAPGGVQTATYQVTVDNDAAGTTQTNLIVPTTPGGECVDNDAANCTTDTDIPAWTLQKTSNPATGSTVTPGGTITYTLTATNEGPGELSGATVQDDLKDVLNNATFVAGSITTSGTGSATLTGTDLDWSVPDQLAVGDSATVSYQVRVNSGAFNVTLVNVATPGDPSGTCLDNDPDNCTTTHQTPGPPSVSPSFATPAFTLDQCVLGTDNAKLLTVSTVSRPGVSYTMTGNNTAAVTITATANAGFDLNVPTGWTGNSDRATITVRATDATLCVGGESSTVPPSTQTAHVVPSATDNVQVLPTHRDEVGGIAYTGVNTIGMSALALLLLGMGVLLLWFGLAVRREQREH